MKKFSTIRKVYEAEEMALANLPQNIQQPENVIDQTGKIVQPEPQPETNEGPGSPVSLFSKLFESREMAHIYHLQITGDGSYSGHKALDKYYNSVLDLIDESFSSSTFFKFDKMATASPNRGISLKQNIAINPARVD
jgi:hypothetical protein